MSANALLKTKLRPPVIGRDTVRRARLNNHLDYHRPLTLVVAPAGYGKTTLLVDWLENSRYPTAWLSLDRYDDSLTSFMSYVMAALETIAPGIGMETRALLNSVVSPPPSELAHSLVNELDALPQGIVLVLDDYHLIQDLAVHQVMDELLTYQPRLLELVLIARHDPPLRLAELRVHNRITEIRAQELRFSSEESKVLLQQKYGLPLDEQQVAALETATEGWAAGLRLAAQVMEQQGAALDAHANLNGSGRFAVDYLANEVFNQLAPAMQEFLLKTAFMEEVCAPLCVAVVGGEASAEECQGHLDTLTQKNLFVFELRGEGRWYRYHHLFRAAVQHRAEQTMSDAERKALHGRASAWLAAHGQIDAAVNHAVQAGDVQAVADLVRCHRHDVLNNADWARLETWRRLIPRAMVEQHPQLCILDAWSFSHQALPDKTSICLDAIESLLAAAALPADEERLLRSEVDSLRSQAVYWTGDVERCLETGRRALAAAPQEFAYTRALAWLFHIVCLEMTGRAEAASAALDDALREGDLWRGRSYQALVFLGAGFLHWVRADMVRMGEYADRMLALAQARSQYENLAYARYFRGCARYQQNDLAGAEEEFATVLELAHVAHPYIYSQSLIGLAATYQAQGEFDKAHATATDGWRRFREAGNAVVAARLASYLAQLNFRQGKMDEALRWIAQPCPIPPASPMPGFHSALVGRAAVLLGQDNADAQVEAGELLALLRASVEAQHNTRFLIEVLALQAVALASSGDQGAALELLERAVLLTVPGEAVRALADLYEQIGSLLEQLAPRSTARIQIARIRRAATIFRPALAAGDPRVEDGRTPPPGRGSHPDLLESLTHREMDVLLLLMERPSNKEIARELNISADTVKRHLSNIFLKLHVENRRQAIVQARRMGILPH